MMKAMLMTLIVLGTFSAQAGVGSNAGRAVNNARAEESKPCPFRNNASLFADTNGSAANSSTNTPAGIKQRTQK